MNETDGKVKKLQYVSLASGSSGNCALLAYGGLNIMLDAGLPYKQTIQKLTELRVEPRHIAGILITHNHADHIRGAIKLVFKHYIPLYCSTTIARALLYHRNARPEIAAYMKPFEVGTPFWLGDREVKVEAFPVPHDATDNVGYTITTPQGIFSLITDIGHATSHIVQAIQKSNFVVLESNYDAEMLLKGRYPLHLKERIMSGYGHISNKQSTLLLQEGYHNELRFVAFCHISKDNNLPELVLKTHQEQLQPLMSQNEKKLELHVLPRYDTSPTFTLEK